LGGFADDGQILVSGSIRTWLTAAEVSRETETSPESYRESGKALMSSIGRAWRLKQHRRIEVGKGKLINSYVIEG
jgi:hypothetical protein